MTNDGRHTKEQLMLIAYQQRISELVAMYEAQIISLRADITVLLDEKNDLLEEKPKIVNVSHNSEE